MQDLEDIEGTFGEEDLREYCEVCNHHWHREYVTWFAHPFETEDGRYVIELIFCAIVSDSSSVRASCAIKLSK